MVERTDRDDVKWKEVHLPQSSSVVLSKNFV